MKITKSRLKQIIKEELQYVLRESIEDLTSVGEIEAALKPTLDVLQQNYPWAIVSWDIVDIPAQEVDGGDAGYKYYPQYYAIRIVGPISENGILYDYKSETPKFGIIQGRDNINLYIPVAGERFQDDEWARYRTNAAKAIADLTDALKESEDWEIKDWTRDWKEEHSA